MRVAWTAQAIQDLRSARAFMAQHNPQAAESVAVGILESVERLAEFPASGRHGRMPNTRELVVSGMPFIIPYRVTGDILEILGVIHAMRKWPAS